MSDQPGGEKHQQQAQDACPVAAAFYQKQSDDQNEQRTGQCIEKMPHLKGVVTVEPLVNHIGQVVERLPVVLQVGGLPVVPLDAVHAGGVTVGEIVVHIFRMLVVDELIT